MISNSEDQTNKYIIMWDITGLECVIDITEKEKEIVFETLQNKTQCAQTLNNMIFMLKTRARFNNQRNYEIYILQTSNISKETIEELFDESPQMIVDLIRQKGNPIYKSAPQTIQKIF
jgi:hypothetical protein